MVLELIRIRFYRRRTLRQKPLSSIGNTDGVGTYTAAILLDLIFLHLQVTQDVMRCTISLEKNRLPKSVDSHSCRYPNCTKTNGVGETNRPYLTKM